MIAHAVSGELAAQGLGLVAGAIVARILGLREFGKYGLIMATVLLLVNWGTAAQQVTVSRHAGLWIRDAPERSGRVVALGLVVTALASSGCGLVLLLAAPQVAHLMGAQELTSQLRMASLLVPMMACTAVMTAALNGLHSYRILPVTGAIRGAFGAVGLVVGALHGLPSLVVGLICANLAIVFAQLLALRIAFRPHGIRLKLNGCLAERSVFFSFSAPQIVASALAAFAVWYSTRIVGAQLGAAEVAGLTIARQWQSVLTFLPVTAASVLLPFLSSHLHEKDRALLAVAHDITLGAVLSVATAILTLSPFLLQFYGREYTGSSLTVQWLVGGTALGFLGNVLGAQILARGNSWYSASVNCIWSIVLVVGCGVFVPRFGSVGVGISYSFAYSASLLMAVWRLVQTGDLSDSLASRTFLSATVLFGMLLIATFLNHSAGAWVVGSVVSMVFSASILRPHLHVQEAPSRPSD